MPSPVSSNPFVGRPLDACWGDRSFQCLPEAGKRKDALAGFFPSCCGRWVPVEETGKHPSLSLACLCSAYRSEARLARVSGRECVQISRDGKKPQSGEMNPVKVCVFLIAWPASGVNHTGLCLPDKKRAE